MDKTRVLLLAIFPRVEQRIKMLLSSISTAELIDTDVNNAEAAVEVIFQTKPDVVLLENDFPGMDGFYLTEIIRRESPATQIIILSEISSADAVRKAMRAGACDYLSYKTVTLEDLDAALERGAQLARDERSRARVVVSDEDRQVVKKKPDRKGGRTRVVAFYSPKGGVGVSTIVTNLAHALHAKHQKVLIIDGSLQYGDIAVMCNHNPTRTIANIADKEADLDPEMIKSVIVEDAVDILPAPNEPEEGLSITGSAFLKIIRQAATLDYDLILLNTNSYISDPTFSALEAADLIIVVVTQEVSSVRAARGFFSLLGNLAISHGKVQVILNRFNEASSLLPQRIGEILGQKIVLTIPADGATAVRAANLGVPFVVDYKDQPISKAIVNLAAYIDSAGALAEAAPAPEEVRQ
jgi:pilus assembly protein CpaE